MNSRESKQNLVKVFFKNTQDDISVGLQIRIDSNFQVALDCYNRYAVKDGTLSAIDVEQTVKEFKEALLGLHINDLQVVLFKYSNTHSAAKLVVRENIKERFKHRLITFGFLLFSLVVVLFSITGVVHALRDPVTHNPGFMTDVLNIVIEVFKIITNI